MRLPVSLAFLCAGILGLAGGVEIFGCRPPGAPGGRRGDKPPPSPDAGLSAPAGAIESDAVRAARRSLRGVRRVHVASISGPLDAGSVAKLTRLVASVSERDALVLEIDAAGGTAAAALAAQKVLLGAKARTVALVEGQATGEAAILALAAEVVVMAPDARWGALSPTQFTAARLDPKVQTQLADAFAAAAKNRGRDEAWARAMVQAPDSAQVVGAGPKMGQLVSLSAARARSLKLSQATLADLTGLLRRFGLGGKEVLRDGRRIVRAAAPKKDPSARRKIDPFKLITGRKRVVVIDIHGTIELGLRSFVLRVLEDARETDLVILDVNTFGGRVDAATQIRDALLKTKAKTVALINPRAISAGALISLACDVIAMTPGGSIGAATPIQVSGGRAKAVGEKVVSYMRKEMKSTAEAKGRRGDLAEAMVDANIEIEDVPDALKESITGLKKGQLLTLTDREALQLEMAELKVKDLGELKRRLKVEGLKTIRPKVNWAETIARFLTGPIVSSILMTLGILGLLLELYTPGFGASGIVGLICLTLFFFGHKIAGVAGWEPLLLFGVGIVLLVVEVFITPGFGVLGSLGILATVASLVWTLSGPGGVPLSVSWDAGYITSALVRTFFVIIVTAGLLVVAARFLPKVGPFKRLALQATISSDASETADLLPQGVEVRKSLEGKRGVAETMLRPAGKIVVDGTRLDVVSDGGFIERGTPVVVHSVTGRQIVVKKITEA